MARARMIKAERWTDEAFATCSPAARLLLIASQNFADDRGNLARSARQLKAQAFPYDQWECEPLVAELIGAGLFIEYQVNEHKYLHIKDFETDQIINHPSRPTVPLYEPSLRTPVVLHEPSGSTPSELIKLSNSNPILKTPEGDKRGMQGGEKTGPGRATRLPHLFVLTPARERYAQDLKLNPQRVYQDFRDYWDAASGAKARKCDWDATWRMWCRNQHDRPANGKGPPTRPDDSAAFALANERAQAIGFRPSWPQESLGSYQTALKLYETQNAPSALKNIQTRLAVMRSAQS